MYEYRAQFVGRTRSSIGVIYPITTTVKAETEEQAWRILAETHETFHSTTFVKIGYAITYQGTGDLRTLFGPAQGRHMKWSRTDGEQYLKDLYTNSGEDRLVEIAGEQARGTFRVDAFDCYEHGDPKGIYVDE